MSKTQAGFGQIFIVFIIGVAGIIALVDLYVVQAINNISISLANAYDVSLAVPITSRLAALKQCPDHWYINQMPSTAGASPKDQYFVLGGKRLDYQRLDAEWVKLHCQIKAEIIY